MIPRFFLISVFLIFIGCSTEPEIDIASPDVVNEGFGDFLFVPAGEFTMGDTYEVGLVNERPVHTVYLDEYYIGKYEVTNDQFTAFLNSRGNQIEEGLSWLNLDSNESQIEFRDGIYFPKTGFEDHPVALVSWYGAKAYCDWLNKLIGLPSCYDKDLNVDISKKGYRLPTEAEWEKAAKGTDQRLYPWGNEINESYANYNYKRVRYDLGTKAVGYYDGNMKDGYLTSNNSSPYGAFDMAGNVIEWCSDRGSEGYYEVSPEKNPIGHLSNQWRVVRGGGFNDDVPGFYLRNARRNWFNPVSRGSWIGFRCVRIK